MIDFTDLSVRRKTYGGANGNKLSVIYNGELYMLKFPAYANHNNAISYGNNCISEYIGCHIFESLGFPVQETILGTYKTNGKEKVVVACKDFTAAGLSLQDFASLKNTVIDSQSHGYGTELSDIMMTIDEQKLIDRDSLNKWFWDMFIADALIGNWDRHNGNWGFLYNISTDAITFAPIFDCGSSLYPQADEKMMNKVLSIAAEKDARVFQVPTSSITIKGKRINYFDFISSLQYHDCNAALKRIVPKIDMDKIAEIVENTPYTDSLQRQFYITMLKERKMRILDYSLEKLEKSETSNCRIHDECER